MRLARRTRFAVAPLLPLLLAATPARSSVPAAHREAPADLGPLRSYQAGDLDRALLEATRPVGPNRSATAEAVQGLVALRRGEARAAEAAFRRALRLNPESSIAHEGLGRVLLRGRQSEIALGHLRKAVELDPCNWRAMLFLAMWNAQHKRLRVAASLLREASTIARDSEPLSSLLWFNLGLSYAALDHDYLAARAYRRALAIEPDRLDASNNLGVLLIDTEQFDEAQKVLEEAVRLIPDNAQLEYLLGAAYYLENQGAEARTQEGGRAFSHLKRAYELGYRNSGLWVALGWSALGGRELELAELCFKRMLSDGLGRPEAQKGLGYVYLRRREFDRSRKYFERSLELAPKDARTMVGLASLLIEEEKNDEALRKLEEAIALDPDHSDAIYKKGTTLMKLGRKDEGRAALARFEELRNEAERKQALTRASRAALMSAQEKMNEGNPEAAAEILAAAVKENPAGKFGWVQYGQALLRAGRAREAIPAFEQALKLDPRLAAAHDLLARTYQELGDPERARAETDIANRIRFKKDADAKAAAPAPGAAGKATATPARR